jgi:two-component sensor histidine kinase
VVSIIKIRQNKVWCSYNQGFVELSDNKFERLPPTRVYITNAVLGNSTDNLAYEEQTEQHPIQLSHKKNQAYFEFTSPVFLNEKEMLYSYRLLGSRDTAWHIPANIHSVQYASLQPGSYQFEVRMLGWNGNFGPITDFSFTVNPPYWKRGWFYLLIAVITLAILYSMYKYRIRQLVKMQQVRNKIATDLHDDIGSTLTNIGILSELSKKNLQQPQLAEKFLMRITEESVASQQALDDIIWSVNTNNDSLASTFARMRRYAAEVFENSSTHCSLEFDNVEPGMKISMDQRRDLYLIFKEGLNNIQKHAEAKTVIIKAGIQHQYLHLSIQDDGKGFYVGRFTERNGLANMQNRAEKWSGTLTINSAPGKGTTIYCKLPLT